MKFYNEGNERIYNNLTKEEQEVIKEELENNFFENELYPHAKNFKIEKIEIIKEENEIYNNVHLLIQYDYFNVPHILKEREIAEIEFEKIFEKFLEEKLGFEFDEDEEKATEEVKKLIFENQDAKDFLISLIEEDLNDYLNRDEEVLFGNYGRKVYKIFETLTSQFAYEKEKENYIFENIDKYI